MKPISKSRRNFLKKSASLGLLAPLSLSHADSIPNLNKQVSHAKNLIFLVADGMGRGTLSLTNDFSKRQYNKPLNWTQLLKNRGVYSALQDTASFDSFVTDSAAASSAWGSGIRVPNGRINVDAQGRNLEPIFSKAKAKGKSLGLVTTTRVTHATPAGFVANAKSRHSEEAIAQQYLERGVDLILGGGARYFQGEHASLGAAYQDKGFSIARNRAELETMKNHPKLLGLFADSHLPYAIDRLNSKEYDQVPSLNTLLVTALERVRNNKNGFFLQVESGRIDHAGHVNDTAAIIEEQLEFDRCIATALEFVRQSPDTLLIVTTDHGCGGCQLNGIGDRYVGSVQALDQIMRQKVSYEFIEKEFRRLGGVDQSLFESLTGIRLKASDYALIRSMWENEYIPEKRGYQSGDEGAVNALTKAEIKKISTSRQYFAGTLSDYFQASLFDLTGVSWTSHQHTSELVDLIACGPHAQALPSFIHNNELHAFVCEALQI